MEILAIETSCDDTCVAILEIRKEGARRRRDSDPPSALPLDAGLSGGGSGVVKLEILSNVISSQVKIHRKYGGVYPSLAKREHQRNLVPVLETALKEAGMLENSNFQFSNSKQIPNSKFQKLKQILKRENYLLTESKKFLKNYKKPKIDLIAVTAGPGLEPCLWVGVNFAKALAFFWNLSIFPVNHIEAHILVNLITRPGLVIQFPAICLVVSGGHTQLILMKGFGEYQILGETRDDAAGECFDKVARILGLGYPGGPAIETAASMEVRSMKYKEGRKSSALQNSRFKIRLPRPMIYQKNFDFSFSGLKTAVLYNYKSQPAKIRKSRKYIRTMANEVQQAIIDVLIYKTIKAVKKYKAKTIILGGGVVANNELRKQFNSKLKTINSKLNFLVPPKIFCTDNAVMIAVAGFFRWLKGEDKNWAEIKAEANIKIC